MKSSSRKSRRSHIESLESRTMLSEAATATITDVADGSKFKYTITVSDTGTTPINTFWYAWTPTQGQTIPATLTPGTAPFGWTALQSADGIQWNTTAYPITVGESAATFTFDTSAAPAVVEAAGNNIGYVYSGAAEATAGGVVTPAVVTPTPPVTPPVTPPTTIPTGIEKASATVVASQLTDNTFQYSLTLKNTGHGKPTAANEIETFWYAWVPGEDFLDTAPLTVTSPTGWTDTITNEGSADGFAIQWVTTTNPLNPGKSLSGFGFTSTDTPLQVFGKSNFFPTTPVNTSFVYAGAPETDTGFQLSAIGSVANPAGGLVTELPAVPVVNATTVPANGDVNPYGVAFVPKGFAGGGATATGDVLVSNFNNNANLQGTGTTIVSVTPAGATSLFYQGPAGEGLTTALGVLRNGFVLVGNVPSTDGTSATVGQGSLLVLDKLGNQVANFEDASLLDGPWDMAVVDSGGTAHVFVSNVLSGTVTRLDLKDSAKTDTVTIVKQTQIASGYAHTGDPAAFELGPTGLVFTKNTLYVASTDDNAIYAIKGAASLKSDIGTGTLIYQDSTHLHGPLGLSTAPNGDLIAAQGDAVNDDPNQPSELVEFTTKGAFVAETPVDASGEGGAFGIAISAPIGANVEFAAVDDLTNSLDIWTIKSSLLHKHG